MAKARRRRSRNLGAVTKKDFNAIADENNASKRLVSDFAGYFKSQNSRFNTTRFENAVASCKRRR